MVRYLVFAVMLLCRLGSFAQGKPVIFNCSESVDPGDVIGIQGDSFGGHPGVWLSMAKDGSKVQLPLLNVSDTYISARIPKEMARGVYTVWIENGAAKSDARFINRARVMFAEFNEIMAGTVFRLFGRNLHLTGARSRVRFSGPGTIGSLEAAVIKSGPYEIQVKAPEGLVPGVPYQLYVSNGGGAETLFDQPVTIRKSGIIPFSTNVPWVAGFNFTGNVYDVQKDPRLQQHATGNGRSNDRAAIQAAIDKAHADGGGIVYLPAGTYQLLYDTGCGIMMRSRVVLKGEGADKTIIQYGYGKAFSSERVKAPYGWTLGWPDSRVEGMGMVWPGGISTSGLIGLTLKNSNENGSFVHTVKNMPEGGSAIILQDCHFDFSNGWGLAMVNVDKLLVEGCTFTSTALNVRGINAPTRTWPWDVKNSWNITFRNNKSYYYAGRFGANGCHHAVFENNLFVRDGDHQAHHETGGLSLDYVTDVLVQANRFEVTGKAIPVRNQGETILSQGGMANQQTLGRVTTATATSLSDSKNEYQDFTDRASTDWQYVIHPTNYSIAIVSGKGAGQWRTISGNTDTSITVSKPWDVIPAPGSRYVVTQWSAIRMIIRDNILKDNNRGIWIYSGGTDLVIAGNRLINSEGIYIRSDQRTADFRYNIAWNILVSDNVLQNTNGIRPAYIAAWLAQVKSDKLFGTGILGLEVRRNTIEAFTPNVKNGWIKNEGYVNYVQDEEGKGKARDTVTPAILGSIFTSNKALHTDKVFSSGPGAHYTVYEEGPDLSQQAAELKALQQYETIHPFRLNMQAPAPPVNPDSLGARLPRTAGMLAASTPQQHLPVRILIYGQSITGSQVFTEKIGDYLKEKFPHAAITIENRSIGGFAASQIVRTAPHDVYHSTADLIIFHVYGGERTGELEEFFTNLRRTSTAEILLMNHHLNADQKKPGVTAMNYLRYIADKYQCELADISTEWTRYLADNKLEPKDLLRDNVHPNVEGNWLLAQLVGRHIHYNPLCKAKPLERIVPRPGKKISFTGNRVDVISNAASLKGQQLHDVQVLLDGKPVTACKERLIISRPGAGPGTWWPAVRRVSHTSPLVEENWTLEVTDINADTSVYTFKVTGSVTGEDGSGSSDAVFTSRSGRVMIEPEDILFNKIKEVFKVATPTGFKVKWSVVPAFPAVYIPPVLTDPAQVYRTTLLSGLTNGPHTLELIPEQKNALGIAYLEVHQPMFQP